MKSRFLLLLVTVFFVAAPALASDELPDNELPEVPPSAFAEDAYDRGVPRVEKRLLVDVAEVRPGETFRAGVLFKMDPGWHIYWLNSGQGGMETEALFNATAARTGQVLWPTPKVYHEAGGQIITFGYSDTVLLFTDFEVDTDGEGEVEVKAEVDYLVCEVDCIPGSASLLRTVPITDTRAAADQATLAIFEANRKALPRPPTESGVDVTVRYSHAPIKNPDQFRVEISAIGCQEPGEEGCTELGAPPEKPADAFVFESIDSVRFEVVRATRHPDAHSGWFVELQGRATTDSHSGQARLKGVLRLTDTDGQALATVVDELFPWEDSPEASALVLGESAGPSTADSPRSPAGQAPQTSLIYVLLLAFLGGALLNLMPCVFPVLAIKVFSFVNVVHEKRDSIYLHSASYTAGIVASMMVLAIAVIALQLVGTHVGWGFQFQEPRFIAAVGAVLIIFALNLFGVFEVTLSPGRLQNVAVAPPSHKRSFGEGVLAVVLATPCSAPFLGTAVGFALASSPFVIALIFFVLGLGLAAPFVALTLIPGAARLLPKPGTWMMHFKQVLGFALLATAIWLLWLIGQMEGPGAITRLLIFFLACSLGAWIFGLVQFNSAAARRTGLFVALVIVAVTAFFTLRFDAATSEETASISTSGPIDWLPWDDDAVQAELAAGRPVFVDFTADWCITCKVNEANVLEHPRVVEAIAEYDVAMFMADWTRRDDRIRLKLAEFGKAGVPMYLVYAPQDPQNPRVLPELLTRELVVSALQDAASP